MMECLEAYSVMLPLFLCWFLGKKYELIRGFIAFFKSKKKVTDPFDVLVADDLPLQENKFVLIYFLIFLSFIIF